MNEFDLRKFLYNNPLLESEAKLKAKKKELEKKEDKLDSIDMKDEDAKEKAAHHKGAIKNVKKEIKDLEKDLKFDEKAAKKEEKEAKAEAKAKKKKKSVKEGTLTKEGLKDMIRERITSILTEEDKDMSEGNEYYEDDMKEAEDVDIDVDEKEEIDVDIEKDVEVDDVQDREEIEVDAEVSGQSAKDSGLEGLLKKAREMAREQGDDKLVRQISNTIIQHERSIAAGEEA